MVDGRKRKRLLGLFFSLYKAVFRIPDVLMRILTTRLMIRIRILLFPLAAFKITAKKLFLLIFCLLLTTCTSVFKDNKLQVVTKLKKPRFFLIFLLADGMEESESGSEEFRILIRKANNHRDLTDPDMDSEHWYQCCGSGSACIRIDFGQLDLDPDPDPGGQKLPMKNRKKLRNFMFLSKCWMFSFGC
jgi:hypothetical protein